jgi:hypothetical protein
VHGHGDERAPEGSRRARSSDRRRRICAYSRYAQTPRHLIVELDAEGTDYPVRTDASGWVLVPPWPEMHHILAAATDKLSQQQILERWPVEVAVPERSTLSRWLKRATRQGVVCCCGSGYRGDPFRYWLPGREGLLWPGEDASEEDKQAWRDRCADGGHGGGGADTLNIAFFLVVSAPTGRYNAG